MLFNTIDIKIDKSFFLVHEPRNDKYEKKKATEERKCRKKDVNLYNC